MPTPSHAEQGTQQNRHGRKGRACLSSFVLKRRVGGTRCLLDGRLTIASSTSAGAGRERHRATPVSANAHGWAGQTRRFNNHGGKGTPGTTTAAPCIQREANSRAVGGALNKRGRRLLTLGAFALAHVRRLAMPPPRHLLKHHAFRGSGDARGARLRAAHSYSGRNDA